QPLLDLIKAGEVEEEIIDSKVRRILQVMFKYNIIEGKRLKGALNTPEHHKIAYHVASEAIVLLKNTDNLLPLDISTVKSIAVIGDNAVKQQAQLGFGAGVKSYEITPLEEIRNKLKGKVKVQFIQG